MRSASTSAFTPIPPIEFPADLPVSGRREEIAHAIAQHPVVIVCGETGSGKTTQLPKIALSMGRGGGAGGKGLIGHTQPRRIAASTVAQRIASELNTPLGDVVGYKVRFHDHLHRGASVKLMTDGILLAEIQSDPLLKAYDTLIIDEAHERSLNIDFLLGYLREILPRRPDLKVIVTSATIDAERFAKHFDLGQGPAPVILVSGRLYSVEHRYRPFEENREFNVNHAIAQALDEVWQSGMPEGDVLVFLPGEREIREATEHLRGHVKPGVEVLPLFSRLSQKEQERVFNPQGRRRIVLATNVAETSLTVPGIRYVVDTGLARVKRYSYRSKVEQLLIEPISQAAAHQRAGRCGRVSEGVCIRLYDEPMFAERARFTDPEILRSSLAAVILKMMSQGLGVVEEFPFLDAPPRRAVADGYQLLAELGAVDEQLQLTAIGRDLAKLPLDPRVGRMLLEARQRHALAEVLVIASKMSVQDVRDRPLEQQQAADTAHRKFEDERSEFVSDLKLWDWLDKARGGQGEHKLSNRKYEQLLREHFVSIRRVREWRDLYTQLHATVSQMGWQLNTAPASYEQLHLSLLSGLLGNIGCKSDDDEHYMGARGIKFYRHPGAHLSKKPGRWIMVSELIETTRLFGRGIAHIDPQWIPPLAGHLLKTQLLDPHWEKKAAQVVALERAMLYGLVIYNNRRINFGTRDPVTARDIFIRQALVAAEWETRLPFMSANQRLWREVQEIEHKSRRQDVLVDEEVVYAYFDEQLPADICTGATLERWYRHASREQPRVLHMTREDLMRHEASGINAQNYPKIVRLGGVDCAVTYLHDPGDASDGMTVTVPLFAMNQISEERSEWLVPGMLVDKVVALLKTLPQKPRARLLPLQDFANNWVQQVRQTQQEGEGSLLDQLLHSVREATQLDVKKTDFKIEQLPPHCLIHFRIIEEHGRQLGTGRHLASLKSQWGGQARSAFQALAQLKVRSFAAVNPDPAPALHLEKTASSSAQMPKHQAAESAQLSPVGASKQDLHYTDWTFGPLPELMELHRGGQTLIGYPALIDASSHVELQVFDEPDMARQKHASGLRRLISLQIKEPLRYLEKNLPDLQKIAVLYLPLGTLEQLREQILSLAIDRAFLQEPWPAEAQEFAQRVQAGRSRLTLIANEVARNALIILTEYTQAQRKLRDSRLPKETSDDIKTQLERILPSRFLLFIPWSQQAHLPRYLKAIVMRLEKYRQDAARDVQRLSEMRPLEQNYWRLVAERKGVTDARLIEFRWLLEELRVSLFAQELRTPMPVSVKRLEKIWGQISH
jgi:ATP-dependent helicase HrpA